MRMHFQPEEVESFEAAKELLIRRCRAWAEGHGAAADPFVLSVALDFRHESIDGRLGFWTAASIRTLLLDWMPHGVTIHPDDAKDAPEDVRTLLRYLHRTELDDPTGDPLPDLETAITDAIPAFQGAMSDERNFGPAKFWAMKALSHGVDVTDSDAMNWFIERVQSGQFDDYDPEVLRQIAARHLEAADEPERAVPQPPVLLPSEAELAGIAESNQIVHQLRTLTEWVGDGRTLTATNDLTQADVQELSELLNTAQPTLIVSWAKQIRLVRVVKQRLVRVAKNQRLLKDGFALWRAAFDSLEHLELALFPGLYSRPSLFALMFDQALPDILNTIYGFQAPFPIVRLDESICSAGHDSIWFDVDQTERVQLDGIRRDLRHTLEVLADLDAVELSTGVADPLFSADLEPAPDEDDLGFEAGGLPPDTRQRIRDALANETDLVQLTPLATYAVRQRMLAAGRYAPLVGELSDASPARLLGMITEHHDPETGRAEIERWLESRGADGHELLLDAIRRCRFRTRAAAMLDVLTKSRPDGERFLRSLRTDPALAPTAIHLMIDDGTLDMPDLTAAEGMLGMAEQFLQFLETGGPDAVHDVLAQQSDLAGLANAIAHSGHPDTDGLLELRTLVIEPLLRVDH